MPAQLTSVAPGQPVVVDGLAFGVLPEAAAQLRLRHPLIAVVHHPLALEIELVRTRPPHCEQAKRRPSAALPAAS